MGEKGEKGKGIQQLAANCAYFPPNLCDPQFCCYDNKLQVAFANCAVPISERDQVRSSLLPTAQSTSPTVTARFHIPTAQSLIRSGNCAVLLPNMCISHCTLIQQNCAVCLLSPGSPRVMKSYDFELKFSNFCAEIMVISQNFLLRRARRKGKPLPTPIPFAVSLFFSLL